MRAGVIGLGQIGGGVATCLVRAGRALMVHDVIPAAATRWPTLPPLAASPAEVARHSDLVFIAVVDLKQIEDVLDGPEGLLAASRPGMIVVILSTIAVDAIPPLAARLKDHGVHLLDCGVLGGVASAERGLTCIVGGEEDVVDHVRPVMDEFSPNVMYMGPSGAGMRTKVARNIVAYTAWAAIHEAATLAVAAGIDLDRFAEVLVATQPPAAFMSAWLERGTTSVMKDPSAEEYAKRKHVAQLLRKDIGAAMKLAGTVGVELPSAQVAYDHAWAIFGLDDPADG